MSCGGNHSSSDTYTVVHSQCTSVGDIFRLLDHKRLPIQSVNSGNILLSFEEQKKKAVQQEYEERLCRKPHQTC